MNGQALSLVGLHLVEQPGGGFARHMSEQHDFAAGPFNQTPFVLINGVESVITALDVNIRLDRGEEMHRIPLLKNTDGIDVLKRRENQGAVGLMVDGTAGAFEFADRGIAVHPHEKSVALMTRRLQIGDVAGMEEIEAAVGDDKAPASRAEVRPPTDQGFGVENFFRAIHE